MKEVEEILRKHNEQAIAAKDTVEPIEKMTKAELLKELADYRVIRRGLLEVISESNSQQRQIKTLEEELKEVRESRDRMVGYWTEKSEALHEKIAMYERWLKLEEARAGQLPAVLERSAGGYHEG